LISVWCVWVVLIGIVTVYSGELHWSLKNFGGVLKGSIASPPEKIFLDAAIRQMDLDSDEARALLLRAEAIDPNLPSKYYLAVLSLEDDNPQEAERLLLELLQIDDTHLGSYLLLIELYSGSGRPLLAQEIAARGVRAFQERATLHDPVPSPLRIAESRKSEHVHKKYVSAAQLLQGKLQGKLQGI
jgi:tetratricopeptide (TPR) repeat protein